LAGDGKIVNLFLQCKLLLCRDLGEKKEGVIYILDKKYINYRQCNNVMYMEDMNINLYILYYKFTGFFRGLRHLAVAHVTNFTTPLTLEPGIVYF
jgi:hypothetical protein